MRNHPAFVSSLRPYLAPQTRRERIAKNENATTAGFPVAFVLYVRSLRLRGVSIYFTHEPNPVM